MFPDDNRFCRAAIGSAALALGMLLIAHASAQTAPRPAIIEVHDPDKGVYTITGYGDLIIYNGDGLFVEMHTDADEIFHNGFDGQ